MLPARVPLTIVAATLCAWLGLPGVAHGQAKLTPPRAARVSQVPYPADASGNAEVMLVLTIDEHGAVRSAVVQAGDEPFASAARSAAAAWRFEPATRDGEPVAAKIRFRVAFVEEPVVPRAPVPAPAGAEPVPTTGSPERSPAARPASRPDSRVIEVLAEGVKKPPSVSSLKRAEVRQLPGAFGDPFRAIEILPGVTPIVSGLPFFYVRGAPPGNVGYFLDGVRVPYLFHAAAGPSVVHPALVEQVDLYAGGYPARYGRYAGAIVAAETTEPRADWHGEANIRVIDAGALVEGGFADGRGTALLGGRYSYTGGLFSLISPEVTLDYRDFQARVTYDLTDRDRVSLFAFGSFDFLSNTKRDVETVLFGSEFYRVDGRYDVRFPGGGGLRAAVTWGFDQTRVADGRNTQNILVGTRVRVHRPLSSTTTLRGGFDMQIDNFSSDPLAFSDPDSPDTVAFNNLFPPRADTAGAGWVDLVWKPTKYFEVTPGLRVDTYYSNNAKAVAPDPRLSVVVNVHENVRLLHALGVANQPPSFIVPIPGLAVASLQGGLQTSLQAASGVEIDLPFKTTATVTGFTNVFLNMTDTIGVQPPGNAGNQIPRSLGAAKGIEVYIRRSLSERIGGFVSYTFSRSTRSTALATFPAAFDRTHVLHSAFGYNLGGGWVTGLRFSAYSGSPVFRPPEGVPESFKPSDPPRDPVFYRLDVRFEKKWRVFDTGWISVVL